MVATINGEMLKKMVSVATKVLEANKKTIDALNVFPVPDGDTGINMSLTMLSAQKEVLECFEDSAGAVATALSRGALRGARGNSGVILSQIFRGFAQAVGTEKEITPNTFARALANSTVVAQNAVMKPREGTILTVSRVMGEFALRNVRQYTTINKLLQDTISAGIDALRKTPEQLPVLMEAGVLDSGAVGLMVIYSGFMHALLGLAPEDYVFDIPTHYGDKTDGIKAIAVQETEEITFGYCTEFFIRNLKNGARDRDLNWLRTKLDAIGDSIVVVGDEELIKVHVHSDAPGTILQYALSLGELSSIKVDNMREQHRHLLTEEESIPATKEETVYAAPTKDFGLVAIATGEGIAGVFKDILVDVVVEGGQTMNPSTEDIYDACLKSGGKTVFIFPNNSNIVLAAEQVKYLAEDREIVVIPTKTIPQGVSAVLAYNPDISAEDNTRRMNKAFEKTKTGQVTFAVRNSQMYGATIQEGDVIGIFDGSIETAGHSPNEAVLQLLQKMITDEEEIITVFFGEGITQEDADALCDEVEQTYPDCSVEVHYGGQPLYYYIFSVE